MCISVRSFCVFCVRILCVLSAYSVRPVCAFCLRILSVLSAYSVDSVDSTHSVCSAHSIDSTYSIDSPFVRSALIAHCEELKRWKLEAGSGAKFKNLISKILMCRQPSDGPPYLRLVSSKAWLCN